MSDWRTLLKPPLTRWRIWTAFGVAALADGSQLLIGPLGWVGGDQIIDGIAMLLTTWLLGFHLLLLPTFVVELIPVADLFPTWLGCVALVVKLRKNDSKNDKMSLGG